MKEKIFEISKEQTTILKGIAIIFILLGHTNYLYWGGALGVNLFLVLSGYGIYKSYQSKNNKDYFINKIFKVYFPYLLVISVLLIRYIYINDDVSILSIICSIVGLDFNYNIDKTMWFISFIFMHYLIFYLSCIISKKCSNKKNQNVIIIIINLVWVIGICLLRNKFWNKPAGVFLYSFSFLIGIILAMIGDYKISYKDWLYRLLLIIMFIIAVTLYNNVNNVFEYFIYALSIPMLLLSVSQIFNSQFNLKYLKFIGQYSFDIYLWEGFFLTNRNAFFSNFNYQLIIDIVTFAVIIFVSIFYRNIIINPLLKKLKK